MAERKPTAWYLGLLQDLAIRQLKLFLSESQLELTAEQGRLLSLLWREDGQPQHRLASALGRDRATLTRMLDILEQNGFLIRTPDHQDGRVRIVRLTEKGRNCQESFESATRKLQDQMLAGFSGADRENFENLLKKAASNFD